MIIVCWIIFFMCAFVAFFAMIGYPIALKIIDKVLKPSKNEVDTSFEPTVTLMIVAHNEESVILSKLENAIMLDYPQDKYEIVVSSDNSTDKTNEIVDTFVKEHKDFNIRLYKVLERKGKTNAQNEAQRTINSEILVMTDANTIIESDAIKKLVSYFASDDVVYVCGKLAYSNESSSNTSDSESTYWNMDLYMRDVESRLQTITAGNGALYACRNSEYIEFDPIECHDGIMPYTYALMGKRALYCPGAIATEKAGEINSDEFNRKVRMSRDIISAFSHGIKAINVFKYKWFSFCYFGHRTCRYSLWLVHLLAYISTIVLALLHSKMGLIFTILQTALIVLSAYSINHSIKNRYIRIMAYYGMTVLAQLKGAHNGITGKSKPFWESAGTTR